MTPEEFEEKYCSMCGTQRCGGITDEEFRDGCPHYSKEYLAIKDKAEKTWPKWKVDHYNNSVATSAHANKLQSRIKE